MQYVHNSIIILISGLLGCNIHYCTDLPPVLLKRLEIFARGVLRVGHWVWPRGWVNRGCGQEGMAKRVGHERRWRVGGTFKCDTVARLITESGHV